MEELLVKVKTGEREMSCEKTDYDRFAGKTRNIIC